MAWLALIVYILSGVIFIIGLTRCAKQQPIDIDTAWEDEDE